MRVLFLVLFILQYSHCEVLSLLRHKHVNDTKKSPLNPKMKILNARRYIKNPSDSAKLPQKPNKTSLETSYTVFPPFLDLITHPYRDGPFQFAVDENPRVRVKKVLPDYAFTGKRYKREIPKKIINRKMLSKKLRKKLRRAALKERLQKEKKLNERRRKFMKEREEKERRVQKIWTTYRRFKDTTNTN